MSEIQNRSDDPMITDDHGIVDPVKEKQTVKAMNEILKSFTLINTVLDKKKNANEKRKLGTASGAHGSDVGH